MPYISSEEAADSVQAREDIIREASAKLDEGITALCNIFNLPSILTEGWGSLLATRITAQHEAHVSSIRQQLRLDSHNLRMFHARSATRSRDMPSSSVRTSPTLDDDATRCATARLVALVIEALKRSDKVVLLFEEFDNLQSTLAVNGVLFLADTVFIRNTMPGLVRCRDKLQQDSAKLKDQFAAHKKHFYLLSDETELNNALRVLRDTILPVENFNVPLAPAVETLVRLARERADVVKKATAIGEELMITWLSLADARVEQEVYDNAVAQLDPLQAAVTEQEAAQTGTLMFIALIFEAALHTPTSVQLSGTEVDVELLLAAFNQYERLTELSREMIEAAGPLIETLTDFIRILRETADEAVA